MSEKEVRVIEWTAPGYEGAFTQYSILPIQEADTQHGELWIVQISTKDNLARALGTVRPERHYGPLDGLRTMVDRLIENRTEDGAAREVMTDA